MDPREEWWTGPGSYNGTECKNCSRLRVVVVDAPDGSERAVCEKCGWDQNAGKYAAEMGFSLAKGDER